MPPVNDTGLFDEITLPAMSPEFCHCTNWPALKLYVVARVRGRRGDTGARRQRDFRRDRDGRAVGDGEHLAPARARGLCRTGGDVVRAPRARRQQ